MYAYRVKRYRRKRRNERRNENDRKRERKRKIVNLAIRQNIGFQLLLSADLILKVQYVVLRPGILF